jgi:hypothetical protein
MVAETLKPHYMNFIEQFRFSPDTLRVYDEGKLIFSSTKRRLTPIIDYINAFAPALNPVLILDRVVGNAAALLLKIAVCEEVYAVVGSELAVSSLCRMDICFTFDKIVPYVINQIGDGMCPMEQLSIGKTQEEFWMLLRSRGL